MPNKVLAQKYQKFQLWFIVDERKGTWGIWLWLILGTRIRISASDEINPAHAAVIDIPN